MTRCIVLGRFQPFHLGHASLVKAAAEHAGNDGELIVAIGSAQAEWEARNPWTFAEREAMIRSWAEAENVALEVVGIEDINDPQNWVKHATTIHGDGVLVTSDEPTAVLYEASRWNVERVDLSQREALEGWRVRQTIRMLSTVFEDDAAREVLKTSVPQPIIEWLIENDAMFRCSTFGTGVHAG